MTMAELFAAVSNFGFPIVISIFLLLRFENKLEKLSDNIQKNTEATNNLINAVNNNSRKR
jgi:hypothetical protein